MNHPERPTGTARMIRAAMLGLLAASLLCLPLYSGDDDDRDSQLEARRQYARNIQTYDFEPRIGDPLNDRDMNRNGKPDYWEAIIDDKHDAYLAKQVKIISDLERPPAYRDGIGHALLLPFDGTPVAMQTRWPKEVDPDLAYEIKVYGRTKRLNESIVRVWVVWLHVDQARGETELDRDEIRIPPGQIDWPEAPFTLRRNDLPIKEGLRTNRLRVICEIVDNPDFPGANRHGEALFDDIHILSRPKLRVPPMLQTFNPARPYDALPLHIEYLGLIENVPGADSPGADAKQYSRSIEIVDLFGNPPTDARGVPIPRLIDQPLRPLNPGQSRTAEETVPLRLGRFGLYYVTIKLFGYRGAIQAEVGQVVGLLPPPASLRRQGIRRIEAQGTYGIDLGAPPLSILLEKDALTRLVQQSGVPQVKVDVWPAAYHPDIPSDYVPALKGELRSLRNSGVHITGTIPPTPEAFRTLGMQQVLRERLATLKPYLLAPIAELGPHIEFWQWGADNDDSFSEIIDLPTIQAARQMLSELTSVMTTGVPIHSNAPRVRIPSTEVAEVASIHIPATTTEEEMLQRLVELVPDTFIQLRDEHIYAADMLLGLAPPKRTEADALVAMEQARTKIEPWISLELPAVPRHGRSAFAERKQLENMAHKAILAKALGFKRIFLGRLNDPGAGFVVMEKNGQPIPRPAFLAAGVLEHYLGDKQYLGSFILRTRFGTFPNFVFGDPATGQAIVAIWYDGLGESAELDRLSLTSAPITLIDMAGNRLQQNTERKLLIPKVPLLVEGISVPMALTRMSIHVQDDPPLLSRLTSQEQRIQLKNYFTDSQLSTDIEIMYAADNEFVGESNWTVRPARVTNINLPRAREDLIPSASVRYEVKPPESSNMGLAPDSIAADKYVQLTLDVNISRPVRMKILRRTRLRSDLEVIIPPPQAVEPDKPDVVLQMRLRWFPPEGTAGQESLTLTPFYVKRGQLPVRLNKVDVPAYTDIDRERPAQTVKIQIPREREETPIWIGLEEDGGTRFFRTEVTEFVPPMIPVFSR